MPISEDAVRACLANLPSPDGRTTLPQSGALSDIAVQGGRVYVSIAVDPRRAAAAEPLRQAAEAALLALPEVEGAVVTLTAERRPASESPQAPAAPRSIGGGPQGGHAHPGPRHQAAVQTPIFLPGVKKVIAVASGKGGVGKSTTAVNLALALRATGLSVGILDADVYGPSLPRLLDIRQTPEIDEMRRMRPLRAHGLSVMSIGFLLEEDTAVVWRGPMVMSAIRQMLKDVDWGELDVIVVDMPPGTGDAQLTLAQSVKLAGAVIVSTPQDLALIDARRAVSMFRKVEVPVLGIVENMSTFVCPRCGERSDIFGHGGAREDAQRLGVPFLGEVPLHMDIRRQSDEGTPVFALAPQGPHAAAYAAIAAAIRPSIVA